MNVSFFGAARRVTGSNGLLEINNMKILVDCGLFQGNSATKSLNYTEFEYDPAEIDYLLLTHAHIDHSGRIPLLFKKGFKGTVVCTNATRDLCNIMLLDSAHIQESSVKYKNRKRVRAGKEPLLPLYTQKDATKALTSFKGVQYNSVTELSDSVKIRFKDAGHILGSAMIEVWITENNDTTKIVFSGDLGKHNTPILRDPSVIEETDYLVLESTYGNKYHTVKEGSDEKMFNIIEDTLFKNGTVIIPSFSVGRTQEMIYAFNKHESIKKRWSKIEQVPVYVDSPLAISATEVFKKNVECYDKEAKTFLFSGDNPLDFKNLHFTKTSEESKQINYNDDSKIIISSSGMCDAGRIRHHLKHNLYKSNCTVLFVGYQAQGSLGRLLLDGVKTVKLFGETINVKARIVMIDGFSGHGDIDDLDRYISGFKTKPKKIFLVHGEEEQLEGFSSRINKKFNIATQIVDHGSKYELSKTDNNYKNIEPDRRINKFKYKRLELIDYLKKSENDISNLSETINYDIINKLDEEQIDSVLNEYKVLSTKIDSLKKLLEEVE